MMILSVSRVILGGLVTNALATKPRLTPEAVCEMSSLAQKLVISKAHKGAFAGCIEGLSDLHGTVAWHCLNEG